MKRNYLPLVGGEQPVRGANSSCRWHDERPVNAGTLRSSGDPAMSISTLSQAGRRPKATAKCQKSQERGYPCTTSRSLPLTKFAQPLGFASLGLPILSPLGRGTSRVGWRSSPRRGEGGLRSKPGEGGEEEIGGRHPTPLTTFALPSAPSTGSGPPGVRRFDRQTVVDRSAQRPTVPHPTRGEEEARGNAGGRIDGAKSSAWAAACRAWCRTSAR
jgi:hypothetical protein